MNTAASQQIPSFPQSSRRLGSMLAGAWLLLLLAAVLTADWLPLGFGPNELHLDHIRQAPFQWHLYRAGQPFHWLGTDHLGRDLLANILFGARTALLVSVPAMALAALVGIWAGSMAGYFGDTGWTLSRAQALAAGAALVFFGFYGLAVRPGYFLPAAAGHPWLYRAGVLALTVGLYFLLRRLLLSLRFLQRPWALPADSLMLKAIELVHALPRLLLILALASLVPPSLGLVVALSALTYWPGLARLVRGEMIRLKGLPFIEAAGALGYTHRHILLRHALPNAAGPVIVACCFGLSNLMALESTLAFLGIGIPPDVPSWGRAITGIRLDYSAWWLVFFPGLTLCCTVLALQAAGSWLARQLSPLSGS
ncbi:MAG: ABC transporter permease [Adhaeribacter sp.]